MYQTPEQLIALNKANLETALRFAGVALDGAERMLDLQVKAAKTALADGIENARRPRRREGPAATGRAQGHRRAAVDRKSDRLREESLRRGDRDPGRIRASSSKSRSPSSTSRSSRRSTRWSRPPRRAPKSASPRMKSGIAAVNSGYDNLLEGRQAVRRSDAEQHRSRREADDRTARRKPRRKRKPDAARRFTSARSNGRKSRRSTAAHDSPRERRGLFLYA